MLNSSWIIDGFFCESRLLFVVVTVLMMMMMMMLMSSFLVIPLCLTPRSEIQNEMDGSILLP